MNQLNERYLVDFAVGQTFGSGRLRIEGERAVCTENLIHVDGMRESPKLTRWLRFYALCLRSWPRR